MALSEMSPVQRLDYMGFRRVGQWQVDSDKLRCVLQECGSASNILYVFVCDDAVLYIGKSIQTLKKRLYGYERPGPTQYTNIKGNTYLRKLLSEGKTVHVHALPDSGLLFYGGFHVNLAAGLEDALVAQLKPSWNGAGLST